MRNKLKTVKALYYLSNILLFLLVAVACSEDEASNLEYPLVHTGEVTNITSSGATFSAKIAHTGHAEIVDHGFVWGSMVAPSIDNKTVNIWSLGAFSDKDVYGIEVHAELMANQTLYVRAYAKTEEHIVYGKAVAFLSLGSKAPLIENFSPVAANIGDTVRIEGKYFSVREDSIKVSFGTQPALIVSSDTSLITAIVPIVLDTAQSSISVSVFGNLSVSNEKFHLLPPVISSFSPDSGQAQAEISITGKNFISGKTTVKFNDTKAEVSYTETERIEVILPNGLPPGPLSVSVEVFGQSTQAKESFFNMSPYIENFTPKKGTYDDLIIIKGQNFSESYNSVKFNTIQAKVIHASKTELQVSVPSYLATKHSKISVHTRGILVMFDSLFTLEPPIVESIKPLKALPGTYVDISGKNFSPNKFINVAMIGGYEARVIEATKSKLTVEIPKNLQLGDVEVAVSIGEQTDVAADKLNIVYHSIDNFLPTEATFGDTIVIQGQYFGDHPENVKVKFNNFWIGDLVEVSDNQISVIIPDMLSSVATELSVEIGEINVIAALKFSLLPPIISDFSPKRGIVSDEVSIVGENFSPVLNNNKVFFGTTQAEIVLAENNLIIVKVPELAQSGGHISVTVLDELSATSQLPFVLPIERKVDFGGKPRSQAISFVINGIGYVGLGSYTPGNTRESLQDIWSYDPATDTWTQKADFAGGTRLLATSFVVNDKGYVATGTENFESFSNKEYLNDLWEYNPMTNQWTQKTALPGEKRVGAVGFAVQSKGYIATGTYGLLSDVLNDVWAYNPATDTWTQKADFPGIPRQDAVAFSIGDKAYLGTGRGFDENIEVTRRDDLRDFWEYNPLSDSWLRKADYTGAESFGTIGFELKGKGIVGLGVGTIDADEILREYDPATDTWQPLVRVGALNQGWRQYSIGFSINGKAYIGLGRNNWSIFGDIWEYDPDR